MIYMEEVFILRVQSLEGSSLRKSFFFSIVIDGIDKGDRREKKEEFERSGKKGFGFSLRGGLGQNLVEEGVQVQERGGCILVKVVFVWKGKWQVREGMSIV